MTRSERPRELQELARAYGVATEFEDWKKQKVEVSSETLVAVLAALGVDASSAESAKAALDEVQKAAQARRLPVCTVVTDDEDIEIPVRLAKGEAASFAVITEDEERRELETPPAGETLVVPGDLPLGYHEILAQFDDGDVRSPLIVTPSWLGYPGAMAHRRVWGLATQLYSVRSHDSWGVGDLTDLRDLAVWSAGEHGADYVLINPLHAAEPKAPMEPSPYLPTSRRFVNPIYLRVEQIEEYATAPDDVRARVQSLAAQVHDELDDVDRIERDVAWNAKAEALRAVFAQPRTPGRQIAFETYCREQGDGLRRFATWSALSLEYGTDWTAWPEALQDPASADVTAFADEHAQGVEFASWLQWCLDEQLRDVEAACVGAGMALGVVHDLAVGVNPHGADAWALQEAFASGIHVGAPPDQFTQLGQDWGQPPLRPDRLAETAYAPFRDMVAGVLRHSGGVRVDHILGLFRLWWVPEGKSPKDGTYVRYDHEAMIGVLALEAQRAGALVVGEDLGTLEAWVQEYLASRGLLGTSILWFEQDWDAERPLPPEAWRELCLASVTTHDLPPTAGYLDGEHVRLRDELGLLSEPLEKEMARDEADRRRWREFLVTQGLLDDADAPNDVVEALHAFLLTTPSRMLNVALVDAVGDKKVQNQPGTANEYPNWRVPLSGPDGEVLWLEDVFTSERAARLCALFENLNKEA